MHARPTPGLPRVLPLWEEGQRNPGGCGRLLPGTPLLARLLGAGQCYGRTAGHHVLAFLHFVVDLRQVRVEAVDLEQIESRPPLGVHGGVGPARHTAGAHAPGESEHAGQCPLHCGLRTVAGLLALQERAGQVPPLPG